MYMNFLVCAVPSHLCPLYILGLEPETCGNRTVRGLLGRYSPVSQTSHKPPVTHAQFYGPDECYILSMHTGFAAKAGLNSLTLNVTGKKNIVYKDGSKIYCNTAPGDIFNNAFFGSLNHQFTGKLEYFDDENKIYATYSIGTQKVQDYLEGFIQKDGKKISEIYGTYCGYLEFDGERYWDARDTIKFEVKPSDRLRLPSDSRNRIDLVSLISGDVEEAQENKEKLEIDQRNDAKLRGHH